MPCSVTSAAPPSDLSPARISQVAVESSGRVHVLRRGEPPVIVYEPDGTFVRSYGAGEIFDSHGISIDAWDRVWIADRDAHQIVVFDLSGKPILRIGDRHRPKWEAPFNHPTRAAVAPDGAIFVADGYGNARIHEFSAEGEWRSSFGEVGAGPRQFMTPHSVIVDRAQRLLVCDRENDRVQVFTREGQWLADWKGLCRPMDLCERDDGVILVTRSGSERHGLRAGRRPHRQGPPFVERGSWCRSRTDGRDLPGRDRTLLGDETHSGLNTRI